MPIASTASSFCRRVWIRRGAWSGRRTASGCGSKVIATEGLETSRARAATVPRILRWPRWTPSKFPIVTTPPRGRSGARRGSRTTRIRPDPRRESGDEPSDQVVLVGLGHADPDDLSGRDIPAGRVVDQKPPVDLGGLRPDAPFEEVLGLLAWPFDDRLDLAADERPVLLPGDRLLE